MAQDKYGFLWMGTEIGLNRYDSDEIKQFFHSPSDSSGLSNSKINTILSDSQGELWIGTAYGLNRYIFEENSFDEFLFDDDGDQLPGKYIRCLFQDTDNDMWVGILLNWKTRFLRTTTTVQK